MLVVHPRRGSDEMAEPTKMTSPGFGRSGEVIVITFAASRCHGELREDGQAH
jgi:hypothetical protein